SFFAAKYAMTYPESCIGQCLHGASRLANHYNPVVSINAIPGGDDEEMAGVPADPVPEPDEDNTDGPESAENIIKVPAGAPATIVINERNIDVGGSGGGGTGAAAAAEGHGEVIEFRGDVPCGAPAAMPFCSGEEGAETLPMPKPVIAADEAGGDGSSEESEVH